MPDGAGRGRYSQCYCEVKSVLFGPSPSLLSTSHLLHDKENLLNPVIVALSCHQKAKLANEA